MGVPLNAEICLLCGKPEFPHSGIATLEMRQDRVDWHQAMGVQETRAGAAPYCWVPWQTTEGELPTQAGCRDRGTGLEGKAGVCWEGLTPRARAHAEVTPPHPARKSYRVPYIEPLGTFVHPSTTHGGPHQQVVDIPA